MRRDCLGPVPHLVHGHDHGASANSETTAAHGAVTLGCVQGIAVVDADLLHRHAQPVGHDLGEARLLPLPVWRDACVDRYIAIGLHAHRGTLERPEATN